MEPLTPDNSPDSTPNPKPRSRRIGDAVGALGRFFIIAGVLTLAFAGFQLWGTGLAEAQAQDSLGDEFESRRLALINGSSTSGSPTGSDAPSSNDADPLALPTGADTLPALTLDQLPVAGDAIGKLQIPSIGLEKTFLEGVSRDDLRGGPGHYPTTPFPGQPGNAAIAGHRTTNGAPFFDIDKIEPGDEVLVETLQGSFRYLVDAQIDQAGQEVGHFIVVPTDSYVLGDYGDNRLTLTACHPKYSAEQRIVVTATLASEPAPASPLLAMTKPDEFPDENPSGESEPTTDTAGFNADTVRSDDEAAAQAFEESLGWNFTYLPQTMTWAFLTLFVGLVAWLVARRRTRLVRFGLYAGASVAFLPCLFLWFTYLDRLIPAV